MVNHLFITIEVFYIQGTSAFFCLLLARSSITCQLQHKHLFSSVYIPTRCKSIDIWSPLRNCSLLKDKTHPSWIENGDNLSDHTVLKAELKLNTWLNPVNKRETISSTFSASQDCKILLGRKYSKAHDE